MWGGVEKSEGCLITHLFFFFNFCKIKIGGGEKEFNTFEKEKTKEKRNGFLQKHLSGHLLCLIGQLRDAEAT